MAPALARRPAHSVRLFCASVLLSLSVSVPRTASCQSNPSSQPPQEYVLAQVKAGQEADLDNRTDRSLDAKWLENLLANKQSNAEISHEGVLISHAVIRGRFSLAGAEISFPVWLDNCEFTDDVDFSWGHFGRSLSLQNSTFDKGADLDHLHLEGDLVLEDAQFQRPLDVSGSNIGGELNGDGARFLATDGLADFDSMQVAQGARFLDATFPGGVTFDHLKAPFLLVGQSAPARQSHAKIANLATPSLNVGHSTIHGELTVSYLDIGSLQADDLTVEGTATIANANIANEVDLRQSRFSSLVLQNVNWPTNAERRQLAGISFQYIAPAPWDRDNLKDEDWRKLLVVVEGSAYNPGAYQTLETALRKEGHTELADTTFTDMNQLAVHAADLGKQSWGKNVLMHYLIGYGRQPQYAFFWWLPVILTGWLVFARRSDVEPRDPKDKDRPYDAFWYSLDLFLPLTRLDAADVWMPRQSSWPRRYYARIHATLGWILVPIALAAVTGLISAK